MQYNPVLYHECHKKKVVTPSRLGDWETPGHDELLLWISENPEVIIEFVVKVDGGEKYRRSNKQTYEIIQGYPIISNNGYLYGKVDTIIKIYTEYRISSGNSKKTMNVLKDVAVLIIDAKPRLDRISATLDQINAYHRLLDFDKDYKDIQKRIKVILTFDTNGRFDSMLAKQGIYVYHVQF